MSKIEGTDFNFTKLKKVYKIPMVLTTLLAGTFGGFTATFVRASLLNVALDHANHTCSFSTIVFIVLAFSSAAVQLGLINKAIMYYD